MGTPLTPQLGSRGTFTLSAPWDTALVANQQYSTISIREMQEIVSAGGDPFTDYYVPKNLDQTVYQQDLQNSVAIVGLQASDNTIVYVPTSYIAAYPDGGGIPYRVALLSVPLGAIPSSLDLSPIITKIQSDVMDIVGVACTVRTLTVSNVTLLSTADAAAAETARTANITNSTTDASKLAQANTALAAAQQQIAALEAYILTLNGQTPPVAPDISSPGGSS